MNSDLYKVESMLGQNQAHLCTHPDIGIPLHKEVVSPFLKLMGEAHKEGFSLKIISGFRSYDRQKKIWEEKANGKRELWNHDGNALLKFESLSDKEKLNAILRWSAIPGASRHHFGSEIDIFDENQKEKEKVKLIPQEYEEKGEFFSLVIWLQEKMKDKNFPFFFPYKKDKGGVAKEPWHLSYRPVSEKFLGLYTEDVFIDLIQKSEITFKELILDDVSRIYQKYFLNL